MEIKYRIEDLLKLINSESDLKGKEFKKILSSPDNFEILSSVGSFFFAVIDLTQMTYQYISPNVSRILGYDHEEFQKKGVQFFLSLYHPDVALTQKAIHSEIAKFLSNKSIKKRINYKTAYDMRVKNKDGQYIRILQQNRFLKLSKEGIPMLMLAVCSDITHYKFDPKQTLVISKIEDTKDVVELKKDFYPEYENGILTKKETEVWKLISNGKTSKEIAKQMNISLHTVLTHRKRLFKKLKDRPVNSSN